MEDRGTHTKTTRALDWPAIVATAFCLAFLGILALYFSTYAPKEFSEVERNASRARNRTNCGAGMFDVVPHDQFCPRYDAIALVSATGTTLTLHADGRARLVVSQTGQDDPLAASTAGTLPPGRYEASVDSVAFRELSNFIASYRLDRRGSIQPDAGADDVQLRAGCNGRWTVDANYGGEAAEVPAIAACLQDFGRRADWSLLADKPVVPATK
jgi:hypothetical protein